MRPSTYRWRSGLVLLTLCLGACNGATEPTAPATTGSVPQPAPATTAAPSGTAADLVAALRTAWSAGDEARLTELVPASASELLGWGRPESVEAVSMADCTAAVGLPGPCELLVGIDASGLLFTMSFSEGPDGGIRIDRVAFAGDAG